MMDGDDFHNWLKVKAHSDMTSWKWGGMCSPVSLVFAEPTVTDGAIILFFTLVHNRSPAVCESPWPLKSSLLRYSTFEQLSWRSRLTHGHFREHCTRVLPTQGSLLMLIVWDILSSLFLGRLLACGYVCARTARVCVICGGDSTFKALNIGLPWKQDAYCDRPEMALDVCVHP